MDIANRKAFLKKTACELPQNIQVGQDVTIMARKLFVVDFGDDLTKEFWGKKTEK